MQGQQTLAVAVGAAEQMTMHLLALARLVVLAFALYETTDNNKRSKDFRNTAKVFFKEGTKWHGLLTLLERKTTQRTA